MDRAAVHFQAHDLQAPRRSASRGLRFFFDRFLLLPVGIVIALVWANTAPESYFTFAYQLSFPVNEIAMAFFFALIAQEITEAMMPGGALQDWRHRTLPVIGALGGIAGAALVFILWVGFKYQDVLLIGWPVTVAVDTVATSYVLKSIRPRGSVVPFALLLAITTDMIGLVLTATRHPVLDTYVGGGALLIAAFGFAWLFRAMGVRAFSPYLIVCGALSWAAFYWEGLHPAFALVPIVPFLPHEPRKANFLEEPPDDDDVHHAEHEWNELVQLIVFLFALVNAGVMLRNLDTGSWALLVASIVGRPMGVLAAVGAAVWLGVPLPHRLGWRELVVVALATSTGLTVALFFATGLLPPGPVLAQIKFGVLMSAVGVLLTFGAAKALGVGRFGAPAALRRRP